MLEHIQSIEKLETEAQQIEAYLNITCSEELEEIVGRGNDLAVYISRTGKMLADAKFHQDKAISESIIREVGKQANIPASVLNKLVNAACKHQNYLVNWIERLNRTATHQLDWLRTLVSKAKEEMRTSSGVSNRPPRSSHPKY